MQFYYQFELAFRNLFICTTNRLRHHNTFHTFFLFTFNWCLYSKFAIKRNNNNKKNGQKKIITIGHKWNFCARKSHLMTKGTCLEYVLCLNNCSIHFDLCSFVCSFGRIKTFYNAYVFMMIINKSHCIARGPFSDNTKRHSKGMRARDIKCPI